MLDVLSQDEVDAILGAVESGTVNVTRRPSPPSSITIPDEVKLAVKVLSK